MLHTTRLYPFMLIILTFFSHFVNFVPVILVVLHSKTETWKNSPFQSAIQDFACFPAKYWL